MTKQRLLPYLGTGRTGRVRHMAWLFAACLLLPPIARACPDLQAYYPDDDSNWFVLERELSRLLPLCLDSPEYFALYGAAQLNSGQVAAAAESLERALLMDPDYGAAQIDYAQALFLQGQIFSALDLNRMVLSRPDLPADLGEMLREREREWRALTRRSGVQVDLLGGYDSNLNRGPSARQIIVTLSGQPLELDLSPDVLPVSGLYSNLRVAGFHSRQQPGYSHNWMAEASGRVSEDDASDIAQFNGRYTYFRQRRGYNWQTGAGLTHLQLGGRALFSATEANVFYQQERDARCAPYAGFAAQYQFYHQRSSNLDAVETRNTGGINCNGRQADSQLAAEISLLNSFAVASDRPGGNRTGWQARLVWEYDLPVGVITSQVSHTRLVDRKGYSELLNDGAVRELTRSLVLLQYRYPLFSGAVLMVNAYHQDQRSNLALFSSRDSALEAGIRLSF